MEKLHSSDTDNTLKPLADFDTPTPSLSVAVILENTATLLRIVSTLMGIILILWGMIFSIRIFNDVYTGVQSVMQNSAPGKAFVDNVAGLIGGKELHIHVEGEDYPIDKILALLFIALGVSILTQLALGIAKCGANIVMYTSSDREAIKKILKYTFSPAGTAPANSGSITNGPSKKV